MHADILSGRAPALEVAAGPPLRGVMQDLALAPSGTSCPGSASEG